MKIGMISSSYPRNASDFAGVFVRSLAEQLLELGHEIHMLAACDPEVRAEEVQSQVRMHYFPYALSKRLHVLGYGRSLKSDVELRKLAYAMMPSYLVSATLHLMALALQERFDVIHSHWVIPTGPVAALASKVLRIPLVVSLHGSDVFVLGKNRVFRSVATSSLAAAKVVTACSDDLKNRTVKAGVPERKVLVLPYGVDAEAFNPDRLDERSVREVRQRMLGKDGTAVVLGIGRLVQKKGFEYLLRAIPAVADRHPDARFVIAGDGDEGESLRRQARELNVAEKVYFPGAVPWHMMPYYLAASDMVVVPSIRDPQGNIDGLPNVLLEAMAAGKPVVASAIAGIPSVLTDGHNGFMVDEKSPGSIAQALDACLASPSLRETVGSNARQSVMKTFSWASVAERMSAIYRTAVDLQGMRAPVVP